MSTEDEDEEYSKPVSVTQVKKKPKKDPKAPKPPRSAYSFFCEEHRPKLKEQGVVLLGDFSKQLSELWNIESDRSVYEKLAEEDKDRYKTEMLSYVPPDPVEGEDVIEAAPKKKKRDPNAPKPARTAYQYFCDKKRPELDAKSLGEASKKLSELWKDEENKDEYHELAAVDKERYRKEFENYQPPPSDESDDVIVPKKKKDPKAPKPARTAYQLFSNAKRPLLIEKGITKLGELSTKISELWREQIDKSEFENLAREDKIRFLKEKKEYNEKNGIEESDDETMETKGKKNKSKDTTTGGKKKKDPNAPKVAKTAYQIFSDEKRASLMGKGIPFGEVSTMLSKLWKEQIDKSEYEEKSRKDKIRYHEEMKNYVPPEGETEDEEEVSEKKGKSKPKKDPNAPKNSRSAYQYFCDESRKRLAEKGITSFVEVSKALSEMWRGCEDKSAYELLAAKDKIRYQNEMARYKTTGGDANDSQTRNKKAKLDPKVEENNDESEQGEEEKAEEEDEEEE